MTTEIQDLDTIREVLHELNTNFTEAEPAETTFYLYINDNTRLFIKSCIKPTILQNDLTAEWDEFMNSDEPLKMIFPFLGKVECIINNDLADKIGRFEKVAK